MVYRFEFESEPLGGIHASYPETHMVKLIDNGNAADLVLNLLGVIGRLYHVGIGEWCPQILSSRPDKFAQQNIPLKVLSRLHRP